MTAIIIVTLLCSAPGQASPDSVQPQVREAWLAQAGAATLGGALAGGVTIGLAVAAERGGVVGFPLNAIIGICGSALTIPAGAAAGAGLVGRRNSQDGKFWGALAGGLVGVPVGLAVGAAWMGLAGDNPYLFIPGAALALTAPGIGATIGYNLSRSPDNKAHAWLDRLSPPTLAACPATDELGAPHAGIDCRLVTVRF